MRKNLFKLLSIILIIGQWPSLIHASGYKFPNVEILPIWEHSCIKHIDNKDWKKAWGVQSAMNFQCSKKKIFASRESVSRAKSAMEEAQRARDNNSGKRPWVCFVPPPELTEEKKNFYKNFARKIYNHLINKEVNSDFAYVIVGIAVLKTDWGKNLKGNNLFNRRDSQGNLLQFSSIEAAVDDYLSSLKIKSPQIDEQMKKPKLLVEKFISDLILANIGLEALKKESLQEIYIQVRNELEYKLVYPTYLSCLNRENELNQIKAQYPSYQNN